MRNTNTVAKWVCFTSVCLNLALIAAGFGNSFSWFTAIICTIFYFILSGTSGYLEAKEGGFLSEDWFALVTLGTNLEAVGWVAYCQQQKIKVTCQPYLEFGPLAHKYAPDFIKDNSKFNNQTGCYEVWT